MLTTCDDRAEARAWRWERIALALLGVILIQLSWNCWLWRTYRQVQAFVQVVQQDDRGQLPGFCAMKGGYSLGLTAL
jgi:hypothetical protein